MPKSDVDKTGANGGADDNSKAGKNTDDANRDKRGNAGDDANDDESQDGKGGSGKPDGKFYTQAELDAMITRRVNREKKDAEDKAQLSKEELLQRERDDARNELRVSNARDAFITATKIDYGKASRLFRMYKDEIEFDDNGKPTNLADVIKTAKSEWSDLFKPGKPGDGDLGDGNGDDGKPASGGMNQRLRNATGRGGR